MDSIHEGPAAQDRPPAAGTALPIHTRYRWRLLGALWVIIVCAVAMPSVGASVVNTHMAEALGFDRTVIGIGFGLFVLTMGVPGPLVAAAIRRFGVKRVIVAGCALLSAGSLVMATSVTQPWQFPLAFGLVVGAGVACAGVLPAQAAVAQWFPDRRALAVSIVLSAIDIGGMVAPPVLEKLIAQQGGDWRSGWFAMFAMGLAAFAIAVLAIRRDLAGVAADPFAATVQEVQAGMGGKLEAAWTVRDALRTRTYWMILVFTCVVGFDWMLMMAHGVIHLHDSGYSSGASAFAVAIMVAASLAGNVLAGVLGDRISARRIGVVAMGLLTVGLAAAVHPRGDAGLWYFAVPVGLGYGASQVCLMALLGKYFGARAFPQLLGLLLAVGTALAAVLVAGGGAVFDKTGSYTPVFVLCVALSVLATIAIGLATSPDARRQRQKAVLGIS
ncbi:MFS transporter [Pandoraea bronchicola]|uniref:Putative MFS-type transporter YhjX n=1 Tax=Pandoraea bronchicola TaxID=2508287 RepID=A0A5E5BVZ9_9BURK|nr:MFS transporter [Pandoraea bronchicola]VVE90491.1 putative MFS-type transporter YhjX [Pandoraea bronchicola]